jgi:gas vesicle protein
MRKMIFKLVMLLGIVSTSAFAQKPAVVTATDKGWHKIGEITASFKKQNESIVVMGKDEFSAIKLKITDAPINIERIEVFYEGGGSEKIDVRNVIKAGGETRVLDLKGTNPEIRRVEFTYATIPNSNNDKAEVELYGFKSQRDNSSESYRDDKVDAAKQDVKEDAKEAENDIDRNADKASNKTKNTANKVGGEISETAAKTGAAIKDKVYVDKVGPDNQKVYIDKHDKYYYINDKGDKVFVTELQLKDNPDKDK